MKKDVEVSDVMAVFSSVDKTEEMVRDACLFLKDNADEADEYIVDDFIILVGSTDCPAKKIKCGDFVLALLQYFCCDVLKTPNLLS